MKNLIFIFSLPRSGSTLLQRLLMGHDQVHSISEPWILLPLAHLRSDDHWGCGVEAAYNQRLANIAIESTIDQLPQKQTDYHKLLARLVFELYQKLTPPGCDFFLDKTPRYYFIIPFIHRLFPDAKYIFLFRNPVATLASILETWSNGRIARINDNIVDLQSGPDYLIQGLHLIGHKSIVVNFEELIEKPKTTLDRVTDYLALPHLDSYRPVNGKSLNGLGDKTGVERYLNIHSEVLNKWQKTLNTKCKIAMARRLVQRLKDSTLSEMGYSYPKIMRQLDSMNQNNALGLNDFADILRILAYRTMTGNKSKRILRRILIP